MEWSTAHPAGRFLVSGLVVAMLLWLAHRLAASATARSGVLLALRAAVLAVLLVILLGPVRVSETRLPARPPVAVVLVDGSRSMALERPVSRIDQGKRIMAAAEALVPPGQAIRIERYGFGRDLRAFDRPAELAATADETRLLDALERLPARMGDDLPTGVVVLSDGRSTEPGAQFDRVAEGYRRLGVPIHVVPLGHPSTIGDVAIQDVVVPREARPGTRVPIHIVLRSLGLDGRRAEIQVRSLTEPARKPLASLPVTLADGELAADLMVDSDRAKGPLAVEVPPFDGEPIRENNRVRFQLEARDPKVRVIYMEGSPGAEYRFVQEALTDDPNIECLSLVVDAQTNTVQRLHRVDNPALGYPTTRQELFGYDVIICSDIDRSAFTQAQLDWTAELVSRRGGGFAMVGGVTSFGAGNWDQTVWDGLIPIDMSGARTGGNSTLWADLKVKVPARVEDHPIWRIVDDPEVNRKVLDRMPNFGGSNLTDRLKPAATVLGVADIAHAAIPAPQMPYRANTPRGRPAPPARLMPIFSCQSFGRGRTFAMSTDTTTSWGFYFERNWGEGDNRYFRKFWRNVVRWLAENSANGNRRLQVETDKVLYRPGQPLRLTARAFDEHLEPSRRYHLTASVRSRSGPSAGAAPVVPMAVGADGVYQAALTIPSLAELPPSETTGSRVATLEVDALDPKGSVAHIALDIPVLDDSPEYRDPRPDHGTLERLAQISGGRVLGRPDELTGLLRADRADDGDVVVSRIPAWDHPALWTLMVGLLGVEWVVRRVKGLA